MEELAGSIRGRAALLLAEAVAITCALALSPALGASITAPAGDGKATAAKKCKKKGKKGERGKKGRRCGKGKAPVDPVPSAEDSPAPAPELIALTAEPSLFPSFAPEITDYVVRCTGDPVKISGEAAQGTTALVDGQGPYASHFEQEVSIGANQAATVTAFNSERARAYHVRCLPSDFPPWHYQRLEQPNQDFYVVSPRVLGTGTAIYVVIFDDHGAPVWWFDAPVSLADPKVLSDGLIAWARANGSGYEIRDLDGTLSRLVSFAGDYTDGHDLQESGNGNLMVMSYKTRATPGDLTFCGGMGNQTVKDSEIQELDPAGNVVWSWNSADHVATSEIVPQWCPNVLGGMEPGDLVHMNSLDPVGDRVVTSLRFTNAVYGIDRSTGDVVWKLGGTTTPESLTVVGDPLGANPVVGQHDARLLPDGSVTIHDNGNTQPTARQPRAVRYAIDEAAGTATLLEEVTDPEVLTAGCCGGARRSSSGSWLMSWGQRSQVTEFASDGERAFRLRFAPAVVGPPAPPFSYRAFPVPAGLLGAASLRAAMNSMFPR